MDDDALKRLREIATQSNCSDQIEEWVSTQVVVVSTIEFLYEPGQRSDECLRQRTARSIKKDLAVEVRNFVKIDWEQLRTATKCEGRLFILRM